MSECDTGDPGVRGFLKVVELEMRRVLLLKLKLKRGRKRPRCDHVWLVGEGGFFKG